MILSVVAQYARAHGWRGVTAVTKYYAARLLARVWGPGRECPCCGWQGREFDPRINESDAAVLPRDRCPRCGAIARHRAYALFYRDYLPREVGRGVDLMHYAAETCFNAVLPALVRQYSRSSFDTKEEEFALDLQALALPSASYDVFLMHHVLSCVEDDRAAVAEMYRTLRTGGVAIAPEWLGEGAPTIEFGERRYGGALRLYGTEDLQQRFTPFEVELRDAVESVPLSARARYGVEPRGPVVLLHKR